MQRPQVTGFQARYFGSPLPASPTTRWYWAQAIYVDGTSLLSNTVSLTGPAGLSAANFIQLSWNPMPGAIGYNIYMTLTSTAPSLQASLVGSTLTSQTAIVDNGTYITQDVRFEGLYVGRAIYNFAVDGGVTGAITPANSDVIPLGAILTRGMIYVKTAVLSGGSATVAVGTTAGSAANSILAATAKASLTVATAISTVQLGTGATATIMSAAGQINITVAAADLTAGVIEVMIEYYMLNP